jgi:hypothetical protein
VLEVCQLYIGWVFDSYETNLTLGYRQSRWEGCEWALHRIHRRGRTRGRDERQHGVWVLLLRYVELHVMAHTWLDSVVHDVLGDLKAQAMAMGDELDDQNETIDRITGKVCLNSRFDPCSHLIQDGIDTIQRRPRTSCIRSHSRVDQTCVEPCPC